MGQKKRLRSALWRLQRHCEVLDKIDEIKKQLDEEEKKEQKQED